MLRTFRTDDMLGETFHSKKGLNVELSTEDSKIVSALNSLLLLALESKGPAYESDEECKYAFKRCVDTLRRFSILYLL